MHVCMLYMLYVVCICISKQMMDVRVYMHLEVER